MRGDRQGCTSATGAKIDIWKANASMRKRSVEAAETLALQGLAFLAAEPERLGPFLAETGVGPADLQARASERETLISVLDWLLANESLLLVFAADRGIPPEDILPARHVLSGELSAD